MKNEIARLFCALLFLPVAALAINGQDREIGDAAARKIKTSDETERRACGIVEKMFAAFNRHDADALAALYAARVFADSPDYPAPKRTPAQIKAHYTEMFRQSPDIRDEIKSIAASGNRVFVEFVASGTIENPVAELPPSVKGKRFSLKIAAVLEIENGKIVRDVTYYDQAALFKQIGLLPE